MEEAHQIKKAILEYQLVEEEKLEGQDIALLDIKLETGRFHQIRVQLSHAGMPILADAKYGSEEGNALAKLAGIRNVALCAVRLRFIHPISGEKKEFTINPENPAFALFHVKS